MQKGILIAPIGLVTQTEAFTSRQKIQKGLSDMTPLGMTKMLLPAVIYQGPQSKFGSVGIISINQIAEILFKMHRRGYTLIGRIGPKMGIVNL